MNLTRNVPIPSRGLNRLIAIAVSNRQFCHLLLTEPERALEMGYCGEPLDLSPEEKDNILSIQAASLPEFAQKLLLCSLETSHCHKVSRTSSQTSPALPSG